MTLSGRRASLAVQVAFATLIPLIGCASVARGEPSTSRCELNPDRVISWSEFHRLPQRRPPYALRYARCGKSVFYVASHHSNDPGGATFTLVRDTFRISKPQLVIIEGLPSSAGISPGDIVDYSRSVQGTPADAESYLAIRVAAEAGVPFMGGEPTDREVLHDVTPFGISPADLLGFYVLRQIEQWRREARISDVRDARLAGLVRQFTAALQREMDIPPSALQDVIDLDSWKHWYRRTNGLPFETGYSPEDAHPTGRSTRRTNWLSDRVADARDRHIVDVLRKALATRYRILIVYGSSHSVVEAPALESAFGRPHLILRDNLRKDRVE